MSLPSLDDLKAVLKIETVVEDALLDAMLKSAKASVQAELGRPIIAISQTWEDDVQQRRGWGSIRHLVIRTRPIDVSTLVIEDADGETLTTTDDYRVPPSPWEALVRGQPGVCFLNGPYVLTADVGLSVLEEYDQGIEPAIAQAILDVAADLYQRRSPNASSESDPGGLSTSYHKAGLSDRVRDLISPWKAIRA